MEPVEGCASGGQRVQVRRADVGAEGTQMAEARVVQNDGDHVGGALGRFGIVGEAGGRIRRGQADLLGFIHGSRG